MAQWNCFKDLKPGDSYGNKRVISVVHLKDRLSINFTIIIVRNLVKGDKYSAIAHTSSIPMPIGSGPNAIALLTQAIKKVLG